MIHPHTRLEFISPEIGSGLLVTREIPRGTLVWVQDDLDLVLPPASYRQLHPSMQVIVERWGYGDPDGNTVLCWDSGRMMNHSCEPSSLGLGARALVARRTLHPGDHLTCDYAECNLVEDLHCSCGEPSCRRVITAFDLTNLGWERDEEATRLAARAAKVDQPLLALARFREEIEGYLSGRTSLPPFAAQSPLHFEHGYH